MTDPSAVIDNGNSSQRASITAELSFGWGQQKLIAKAEERSPVQSGSWLLTLGDECF
jgi:hypothetical protein